MALGPKQMGEAILRNLESKTGKSLEQWHTVVKNSKLTDKKSVMDLLKTKYGVGHFQAQKIFECFTGNDAYANTADFIPSIFNTPYLMKAYKKIETSILKMGNDIRIQPCKTYVPFYRKNQFAVVKVSKDKKIVIGMNLKDNFKHPSFKKTKSGTSKRINFETRLDKIVDFNNELLSIVKTAYQNN
jgi:predicted transport protein